MASLTRGRLDKPTMEASRSLRAHHSAETAPTTHGWALLFPEELRGQSRLWVIPTMGQETHRVAS